MYPNRDEILKGLNDLISTIHKILQAKDQEEAQMQAVAQHNKTASAASGATGDASSALAADDAAQSAATQSPASAKPLTAAEILFANFPDDEEQDENFTAGAAPAAQAQAQVAIPQAEVVEDAAANAAPEDSIKTELKANAELAATVGEDQAPVVSESLDAPQTEEDLAAKALEIRFKLCKHIIMQVDSSLGDFQDMLDTMEYYQDEKYEEARRLVAELEDCTNALIAYLRQHNRY